MINGNLNKTINKDYIKDEEAVRNNDVNDDYSTHTFAKQQFYK